MARPSNPFAPRMAAKFVPFLAIVSVSCLALLVAAENTTYADRCYPYIPKTVLQGNITFPRDYGNHPQLENEWWYYIGTVSEVLSDASSASPRVFGVLLNFLRQTPNCLPSNEDLSIQADMVIADTQAGLYHVASAQASAALAPESAFISAPEQPFEGRLADSAYISQSAIRFSGFAPRPGPPQPAPTSAPAPSPGGSGGSGPDSRKVAGHFIAANLSLGTPRGGEPFFGGIDGCDVLPPYPAAPFCAAAHLSSVHLPVNGTVSVDGTSVQVAGHVLLSHQWSSLRTVHRSDLYAPGYVPPPSRPRSAGTPTSSTADSSLLESESGSKSESESESESESSPAGFTARSLRSEAARSESEPSIRPLQRFTKPVVDEAFVAAAEEAGLVVETTYTASDGTNVTRKYAKVWDFYFVDVATADGTPYAVQCTESLVPNLAGVTKQYPFGNLYSGKHSSYYSTDWHTSNVTSWTSPNSGLPYPTKARVRNPSLGVELTVETYIQDNEIFIHPDTFVYFEGMSKVTGSIGGKPVSGTGVLEHYYIFVPPTPSPAPSPSPSPTGVSSVRAQQTGSLRGASAAK